MIRELEKMCLQKDFDISKAEDIIREIDVNQVFRSSDFSRDTTFLQRAVDGANYAMVELLLKHGADPNLVHGKRLQEENVLWDLQYPENEEEENQVRLSIAKLLLENGANPHIEIDGETLYHWVIACSQEDMGQLAVYRGQFLDLLEEYFDLEEYMNNQCIN